MQVRSRSSAAPRSRLDRKLPNSSSRMTSVPGADEHRRRGVPLDGTFNFRDVGGYETIDGGITRWRRLYRSDALHRLTDAAQRQLIDFGVTTIIDLRTDAERRTKPDALPVGGPTVVTCPIPNYSSLTPPAPRSLTDVYNWMLDNCGDAIVAAIRALARPF